MASTNRQVEVRMPKPRRGRPVKVEFRVVSMTREQREAAGFGQRARPILLAREGDAPRCAPRRRAPHKMKPAQ